MRFIIVDPDLPLIDPQFFFLIGSDPLQIIGDLWGCPRGPLWEPPLERKRDHSIRGIFSHFPRSHAHLWINKKKYKLIYARD